MLLYCHLRQQKDLPSDMWFDSRFEDMLLDAKKQNGDYFDLEECCIWREWYLPKLGSN